MRRFRQLVVIAVSTGLGLALGRYVLVPTIYKIMELLSKSHHHTTGHDFGDMAANLIGAGYDIGLAFGVGITAAVLGGFLGGLVLSRHVGTSNPWLFRRAA